MAISRRGFLGLLLGGGAVVSLRANPITKTILSASSSPLKKEPATPEELLFESYFSTLKINEGEKFYFYLCSVKKITIGYGTNTEDNPSALTKTTIYCNQKPLTETERKALFKKMEKSPGIEWRALQEQKQKLEKRKKELTEDNKQSIQTQKELKKINDQLKINKQKENICNKKLEKFSAELKKYTIQKEDAERMARTDAFNSIKSLKKILIANNSQQTYFFNLPLCMQTLALDIFYNIGGPKFKNYKKFQAALKRGDFATAVKESIVYTNPAEKKVNIGRELRKKRSFDVMNIVRQNYTKKPTDVLKLVAQNHEQANLKEAPADRKVNLEVEASLAFGEYLNCHRILAHTHPNKAYPMPTVKVLTDTIKEVQKMTVKFANDYRLEGKIKQQNTQRV